MLSRDPEANVVVFTERSALLQWKKEIEWLCPGLQTMVVTADTHKDIQERKKLLRDSRIKIKITTYYTVYSYLEDLLAGLGPKPIVIADECNYFKNCGTKMFKQMQLLSQAAFRFYGLTATIIENRLEEAYHILRVVAPGTIPSRKYFDNHFTTKKIQVKEDPISNTKSLMKFNKD